MNFDYIMRRKSQLKIKRFKMYGRNGVHIAGVVGEIMNMVCKLKVIGRVTRLYAHGNQRNIMKHIWELYVAGL
jgi:hypothetical protein